MYLLEDAILYLMTGMKDVAGVEDLTGTEDVKNDVRKDEVKCFFRLFAKRKRVIGAVVLISLIISQK